MIKKWGEVFPKNFRIFDNDYFKIMKKIRVSGGAETPEMFAILGTKILLTSKKSGNQQRKLKRVKISRDITVHNDTLQKLVGSLSWDQSLSK